MKHRGMTLIELMVGVVILGILMSMAMMFFSITPPMTSNLTYGPNGWTESRCIEGYKFILGADGGARQIIDEMGKGVKCQKEGF